MRGPVYVLPRWQILPPDAAAQDGMLPVRLVEGRGFGDGTHPTTALCLQALAALAPTPFGAVRLRPQRPPRSGASVPPAPPFASLTRFARFRLLDFGSGSGILSVAAAAHLGAAVDAVEIDAQAIDHAARNFRANGVAERVRQLTALEQAEGPYDFVVANILRSVLVSNAERLASLLARSGILVLSGLVSTDTPEVSARYGALLERRPEIYEREEWRALVWR